MKTILILVLLIAVFFVVKRVLAGPSISPSVAASRVAAGTAVLIDVRDQWKAVLAANRDKELVVYCASGARSGIAADMLRREGFSVLNAGGFGAWRSAGLPVRQP